MKQQFRCERIDSISQLDLTRLSKEKLRCHYGTGVQITVGGIGQGKKYRYRTGIQTDLGDIEISVWICAVEALIENNQEQNLFLQLKEWVKENYSVRFRNEKELVIESMKVYTAELNDNEQWCDYVPFNQKYRPECLRTKSADDS